MWAHVVNAALGLWLMAAPAVLNYGAPAQTNDRIVGPVIATFAIVAWWEATRAVGRWNLPIGVWLLIAPWLLGYGSIGGIGNSLVVGVLVTVLSLVQGTIEGNYGGGWSALWSSSDAGQTQEAVRANSGKR